jgi:hypothetical protein
MDPQFPSAGSRHDPSQSQHQQPNVPPYDISVMGHVSLPFLLKQSPRFDSFLRIIWIFISTPQVMDDVLRAEC